jgi:hypothetical protein
LISFRGIDRLLTKLLAQSTKIMQDVTSEHARICFIFWLFCSTFVFSRHRSRLNGVQVFSLALAKARELCDKPIFGVSLACKQLKPQLLAAAGIFQ